MNAFSRIVVVGTLFVAFFALVMAADVKAPATEPNAPKIAIEPNAPKVIIDKNAPVVTVNGSVITEGDVDAKIGSYMERLSKQMAPAMVEQYRKRIKAQAVEGMVIERLLDAKMSQAAITVTDKDVNDKMDEFLKQQNVSLDALKSMLMAQGQSFDQFSQQMRKGLMYEKLVQKETQAKFDVNDADALAFYNEHKEDFNSPEQIQASHILIKVLPTAPAEEKAAAKAKIDKLLKQVKDGGDFAALAKENSDCPSKAKGGDLGSFPRGAMVKSFEDAAFALQPGQVSDVVETQFGYHIIKLTDHKPAGVTPFEKAKEQIVTQLKQQKQNDTSRQYIERLKADAKIVYPPGSDLNAPSAPRPVQIPAAPK